MAVFTKTLWPDSDRTRSTRDGGKEAEAGTSIASRGHKMIGYTRGPRKIAFFGHFDGTNFGNESSLQAALYHLRRLQPEAQVTCICSGPETTASTYHVKALPFNGVSRKRWTPKSPVIRVARKFCVALRQPVELVKCIRSMRGTEILVIPGTGLLTDAYSLRGWGPFGLLKWSLIARACGSKVALVGVGAGPINSIKGRWCIRLILSLAEFRSYRDTPSLHCLQKIGLAGDDEAIFPDLAFSLPESTILRRHRAVADRPVVGLGIMDYSGTYNAGTPTEPAFLEYLETLVELSKWLMDHGYDIRLLSGDLADSDARRAFRRMLEERLPTHDREQIIDEPVASVGDVLSQIASCDFVVATRFHNIVFGFLCGKPVISISFHHKCEAVMEMMGMSDYCLEMGGLKAGLLIDAFCRLEANAHAIRPAIQEKITAFQQALDKQYAMLFGATRQELRAADLVTS